LADFYDPLCSTACLFTIPQDTNTQKSLLAVDRHTKEDVRIRHGLVINYDWQCNTIANMFVETMIKILGAEVKSFHNPNVSINFYDLMYAYVTLKQNEDAEKEGNINIAFRPGPKMLEIIEANIQRNDIKYTPISPAEKFLIYDDPRGTEAMAKLEKAARMDLSQRYSITIAEPWYVIGVTYIFIENMVKELLYRIGTLNERSASINFNDTLEIHVYKDKTQNININIRPGVNAKLLIKSDEVTEEDYSE